MYNLNICHFSAINICQSSDRGPADNFNAI